MRPLLVIDAVGLTAEQLGARTPHLSKLAARGFAAPLTAILPAVTLSAQATLLTGLPPTEHGAVGNGWYWRELGEAWLWRQPNAIVRGEKLYERARRLDLAFTCAKLFWWWNLGAAVDWSITPRPFYPADGRKIPAIQATPREFEAHVLRELGPFPFFDFWGPRSGLASSRWIADATKLAMREHRPTLTLAYLPHLDYDHQRHGPRAPRSLDALSELDALVGELVAAADDAGAETLVVSEYGIEDADTPVHVNRALREAGLLEVRDTPVGEVLDPFASRAFAVADHQIAHVYVKRTNEIPKVRALLERLDGVGAVLDEAGKRAAGIAHERAGELVAVARKGAWFTYYHWLDDARAPDFARTVDIHRKPGYDPCELFVDPRLAAPKLRVALRLAQKMLGMRYLMDVIPLDAGLVKGTHGRVPERAEDGPVLVSSIARDKLLGSAGASSAGPLRLAAFPDLALRALGFAPIR
ncbi:MAG: alkaline phosphatase family protein [Planctomycetes bacterium]|nr:alkaline phosphatase family protein [Planctomycetota bacterium]